MTIFNPEHDTCIANGSPFFVPPETALKFGRDCAGLTSLIVGDRDGIIPWGWNAVLRERLRKQGVDAGLLPADLAISEIRHLSHRRIAADAMAFIRERIVSDERIVRWNAVEMMSLEKVEVKTGEWGSVVLKAPWSGSGRGLRWVRSGEFLESDSGWCRNTILKQGSVFVEKREEVVQDFAMLFRVDCRMVSFVGYSLFFCENGAYRGNVLASDGLIETRLSEYVGAGVLDEVRCLMTDFLRERFAGRYEGFVGADMFICRGDGGCFLLHPVVELNVRMTMGLLAHSVFRQMSESGKLSRDGGCLMTVEYEPTHELLLRRIAATFSEPLLPLPDDALYAVCLRDLC